MIRLLVLAHAILFISSLECCRVKKWDVFKSNEHIAALVLARGGSKGIKLKNLARVGRQTLLERSLRQILANKDFNSVWVSTDHFGIALEAERVDKSVNIHWRSAESATDYATSIFAVQEFLQKHHEVDIVALVQCTSPFIRHTYIQQAMQYIKEGFECTFAVSRTQKLRWRKQDGLIYPLNFDPANRIRRQDSPDEYVENGMFYITHRKLLNKGLFQSEK